MRKISVVLIMIIIFNFIFCNFIYATSDVLDGKAKYSEDSYNKLTEKGIVNKGGVDEKLSVTTSASGSTNGIAVALYSPIFYVFQLMMTQIANSGGLYKVDSTYSAYNVTYFNICSLVFGEYLLFDGKIYQTTQSLNSSITPTSAIKIMDSIKENAMGWFYVIRNFALGLFLAIIIYAGARLGASVLADERARWKKILIIIVSSMAFVFLVQPLVVAINVINDRIMDILWVMRKNLENNGYVSFEVSLVVNNLLKNTKNAAGFRSVLYSIEYSAFVVFEIIFFLKYFIRALMLMLLVVLSPVIGVINAWNKISGKQVESIKEWIGQYISTLAMQPMHAFLYLFFIFTVGEIALRSPLLGMVFLFALSRSEKILKIMLNIDTVKIGSLFGKKK